MKTNLGKSAIALTFSTVIGFTALPAQAALLVSSSGDNSIKQYDETTGAYIRDFVTSGSGGLTNPGSFSLTENGNLFVSSSGTNSIKEYNGESGEYIGDLVNSSGELIPAGNLAVKDDSLFVVTGHIPGSERDAGLGFGLVTYDSGVVEYDINTGELVKSIGARSAPGVFVAGPQPVNIAIGGPNDNLFLTSSVARSGSGSINEYNTNTGQAIQGLPNAVSFLNPQAIAVGDNALFYTDYTYGNSKINRVDLATGIGNVSFPNNNTFIEGSDLTGPLSLAVGNSGELFVGVPGTNSVKKYDSQTGDFLGDITGSGSGGLSNPTFVTTANVPVPEPSSVLGVLAFGGLFAGSALCRRGVTKIQK